MPYEIINRVSDKKVKGVKVGSKVGEFRNNIIRTEDAGLARDIRQRFGQDRKDGQEADVLVAHVPDRTAGKTFAMGVTFDKDGNII